MDVVKIPEEEISEVPSGPGLSSMTHCVTGQPPVKTRRKEKGRKDLTVKPIRFQQEVTSLKRTIKFKIRVENVEALETQVAGHGLDSKPGKDRGMLLHEEGFVLKPVQAPPKGQREVEFYQRISASLHPIDTKLYSLIPKFYGTERVKGQTLYHEQYIILENLTQGLAEPCVMDIKVGARTYGPDATEAKIKQEDSTYAGTKKPLGFSVLGIISRDECGGLRRWRKCFGMNLPTQSVGQILDNFIGPIGTINDANGNADTDSTENNCHLDADNLIRHRRHKVAVAFLRLLDTFVTFFLEQREYHLYASSLLFVYDRRCLTAADLDGRERTQQEVDSMVRLKLIDFAHVFPAEGQRDENFLFGLTSLRGLFEQYANREYAPNV